MDQPECNMPIEIQKEDLSIEEIVEQNSSKDDIDVESLSSITSLTMTASSQVSQRSVIKVDTNVIESTELGCNDKCTTETDVSILIGNVKDEVLVLVNEVNDKDMLKVTVAVENIESLMDELVNLYTENVNASNKNIDEVRRDLANVLKELKEKEEMISHITKGERALKDANDTLNEYIYQAEEYYSKELGTLKAKFSLTRIENEASLELEKQTVNEPTTTPPKPKKRRRSSLKFWKKSISTVDINFLQSKEVAQKLIFDEIVKRELESKCIKIEELRTLSDDLEKRNSLLQTTLINRNIEISSKQKRIDELKNHVAKVKNNGSRSCELINEIQNVLVALTEEVKFLESECKEHRNAVKVHHQLLEKLEWHMYSLNEENKIVLSRVNKKNYEINLEKLKTEAIVRDMKVFLAGFLQKYSLKKVNVEKEFQKYGLNKLIQLSHDALESKKMSPKQSTGFEKETTERTTKEMILLDHKAVQTHHSSNKPTSKTITMDQATEQKILTDDKSIQTPTKLILEEKCPGHQQVKRETNENTKNSNDSQCEDDGDSGLELNQRSSITSQIFRNQNMENNKEFFEELIAYVEHVKNKEIDSYKQNLSILEQDNLALRQALLKSCQLMETMKPDQNQSIVNNNKTEQKNESTPKQERSTTEIDFNNDDVFEIPNNLKRNQLFEDFHKMKVLRKQHNYASLNMNSLNVPMKSTPPPPQRTNQNSQLTIPNNGEFYHSHVSPSTRHDYNISNQSISSFNISNTEPSPNSSAFLHSYEIGNSLIQDIFDEKDQLEQELVQSREVLRGRRKELYTLH